MARPSEIFADTPVVAAVKSDLELQMALDSDCQVVFLLYGSILNVAELVDRIHRAGKYCFVHMDLLEGFSSREIAVDGLTRLCCPDGIISTKIPLVRRAKQLGMIGVLRMFLLDSLSMKNLLNQLEAFRPDYVEVLPGVIPGLIWEITRTTTVPLIAGGLIRTKEDVIAALRAGAVAVSTSSSQVWDM